MTLLLKFPAERVRVRYNIMPVFVTPDGTRDGFWMLEYFPLAAERQLPSSTRVELSRVVSIEAD